MNSIKTAGKFLIIAVLVFFMINTTSLGLYQNSSSGNSRQDPVPSVFGEFGENQWYVTGVTVFFDYEPEKVLEIQYKLDDIWHVYNDPFNVVNDGVYMIPWFWIDQENQTHNGGPIEFKIDKSPPTIEISRKSGGKNKFIFIVDAEDTVSAIWWVDFYLDDVFNQTDNEAPFEYTWTGEEKQTVYAICYNYAGFSTKSNTLDTSPRIRSRNINLVNILFVLMQKIFTRLY